MFLKAVTRLPQVHGEWLFAAELADSGLLAVYPKTHWKELGLAPAGTRQSKWAFFDPACCTGTNGFFACSFVFSSVFLLADHCLLVCLPVSVVVRSGFWF